MENNDWQSKYREFVIEFGGKPKHDTRYASTSERCKVHSGLCMIEPVMTWPEAEQIRVVEKSVVKELEKKLEIAVDTLTLLKNGVHKRPSSIKGKEHEIVDISIEWSSSRRYAQEALEKIKESK